MIEYSLDEDDWVAFQEHHGRTSPSTRRMYGRVHYGVATFYLLVAGFFFLVSEIVLAIIFAFIVALWLALYPSYYRRMFRKRARALFREGDNSSLYGPHQLFLEGGELVVNSPSGTRRIHGSSISRIDSTEAYLFIYLSGTSALLIPRAKVSTGDLSDFERELRTVARSVA